MAQDQLEVPYFADWFGRRTVVRLHELPIVAKERYWLALLGVSIFTTFSIILLLATNNEDIWIYFLFLVILLLSGFFQAVQIFRIFAHGPNTITVAAEGLSSAHHFTGVLPWTALATVHVMQYQRNHFGPPYLTLLVKDQQILESQWKWRGKLTESADGSIPVRIWLGFIPESKLVAAAIVAAAAKYGDAYTWYPVVAGSIDIANDPNR